MFKLFFSSSLIILLLIVPAISKAQQDPDTGVDGYENIAEALKHPAKAQKIWITGTTAEIKLLTENAAAFKNISAFKIKDAISDANWEPLFTALSKQASVKEMELTFNDIEHIPAAIAGFKSLEKLTIWGSERLNYPELLKNLSRLPALKSLELNSNGLSSVPSKIKSLKHLERFAITDNETTDYNDLVEKLSALPDLKDLSLEVNAITQLPPNITRLKNLKKLNISNNYISTLPDNMSELKNLDSLQADGNLFVNYVDEFNKMKGIDISYLSVDGGLTEEEKAALLNLFPKAKVEEKASAEELKKTEQASSKQAATNPLFEAIIPELDVPTVTNTVDAGKDAQITYASGTQISVPEDAFVDKNNKPVTGSISIAYREFSNPVDIAASGIPMTYSNGSIAYPMQSAGMFQLSATQNGEPIFLKQGKGIDVSLVTSDTSDTYNFYKIDSSTKAWVDQGKRGTIKIARGGTKMDSVQKALTPVPYSNVWMDYRRLLLENDTTLFASRFKDSAYCYLTKYRYFFNNNKNYSRFVRVSRYKKNGGLFKKAPKGESWFNVSDYTYYAGHNPELRAFGNMVWVYDGEEAPKDFSKKYLRKKRYSDIRIEQNGNSFVLHLKDQHGIVDVAAHPVSRYKGSMEKVQKNYDRRLRNYSKALTRRERSFNRNLYKTHIAYNKTLWKNLKPRMEDPEKKMSYDQWITYYEALNKAYPDSMALARQSLQFVNTNTESFRRSVLITRFGYHNFDKPVAAMLALPVPANIAELVRSGYSLLNEPRFFANITVNYTNQQGQHLKPVYVVLIDKRVNAVSNVGAGISMRVAIRSDKNLLAVMPDGSVGLFSEDDFRNVKLRDNQTYTFGLKVYNKGDLGELRKYLIY